MDDPVQRQHATECEYWFDQYPWECTCGVNERTTYSEWVSKRHAEWAAKQPVRKKRKSK